jgi:hypothetical protein
MSLPRQARRRAADEAALAGLARVSSGWVNAFAVARAAQWPWRSIARALIRLAAEGRVRQAVRVWYAHGYRRRATRVYRLPEEALDWGAWPDWAVPYVAHQHRARRG